MIFLGCLFDRQEEKELLKNSLRGLSNQANTYQWNLIDGLNKCLKKPVNIINVLPVGTWPRGYKRLWLKDRNWSYDGSENREIGCLNLTFIKQFSRQIKIRRLLRKNGEKNILIYSPYLPFLKAIRKLDKSYNITMIVTDLPEFYDLGKTTWLRRIARKINNRSVYKCMKRIDSYVLLTEQMREPLGVGERPVTIVEGIANDYMDSVVTNEDNIGGKKIILYTGTLHYLFGIKTLLDAFCEIDKDNYEFWICGAGEAESEIRQLAESDKRIKYYGYCTKDQVYDMQKKATILVNPRSNEGEYTKYSFPSKTMEYMLSGKPVLMYKLDGIPDEYDEYLNYIEGESVAELKKAILDLCEKTFEELEKMGEKSRNWVLREKNSETQAKRIIDMIGD